LCCKKTVKFTGLHGDQKVTLQDTVSVDLKVKAYNFTFVHKTKT